MSNVINELSKIGLVPVIKIDRAEDAKPLAKALIDGGLPCAEVTFRTACAKEAIAIIAKEYPDMIVGAGTVVNVQQLHDAVEAGAKFIVSPGSDAEVIAEAIKLGVPITPGVVTPSEIMIGLKLGLKVFKFFPAENYGGLKTIKALSGPFPQIKILPTGGINQNNAAEYFKNPKILAVGGSWMCTKDMISSGNFDGIAEKSAAATALFREIRG
jgi:2-dehydro-3-deoxyphosphogluconate aldolase/(4S)-4-hydroxy-2-oxoglutarate aldolase